MRPVLLIQLPLAESHNCLGGLLEEIGAPEGGLVSSDEQAIQSDRETAARIGHSTGQSGDTTDFAQVLEHVEFQVSKGNTLHHCSVDDSRLGVLQTHGIRGLDAVQ
jgi:hypothetical protein